MRRAAALLIAVALLALGLGALSRSSLFALERLQVRGLGASRVTARALALPRGTSLLLVSSKTLAKRALAADPWAATAVVAVSLPHTMSITLVARHAVALVEAASASDPGSRDGLYALDASGRVLPATAQEVRNLPLLTGLGERPSQPFVHEQGQALSSGMAVVHALPSGLLPDISEVHVESTGDTVELVLMDARPVLLGLPTDLLEKLTDLTTLLRRYPWPEYAGTGFDLRDPGRPSLYTVGQS